jgi:hypothetical protein
MSGTYVNVVKIKLTGHMCVYKVELRTDCNYVSHIRANVFKLRKKQDSLSYVLVYIDVAKIKAK